MKKESRQYQCYVDILKEELKPAMGCTEPIALALASAKARELLGEIPDYALVQVSGSIIKNVKSVIVPNTNQMKGISAAVAAGIMAGDAGKELEVLSEVRTEEIEKIEEGLRQIKIEIEPLQMGCTFDIIVTVKKGEHSAKVRIANYHTNIVLLEKDEEVVLQIPVQNEEDSDDESIYNLLNMEDIWDFANSVQIEDIREVIQRQIDYNVRICEEGLSGDYGANIGKVLLKNDGNGVKTRAKAKAAAGSDARMNGCDLPVIINSGSGNQGITCSIPVIEYAKEYHASEEETFRALVLSNLVAIHQKTRIGRLSAYCGAVSAGAAAGAGISYIMTKDYEHMTHTVVNALAISSGIICDGAKASCAAKIALSIDAGILGLQMYESHQQFYGGDGIVKKGIEQTIHSVGRLGKDGMKQTNEEIIKIMTE